MIFFMKEICNLTYNIRIGIKSIGGINNNNIMFFIHVNDEHFLNKIHYIKIIIMKM